MIPNYNEEDISKEVKLPYYNVNDNRIYTSSKDKQSSSIDIIKYSIIAFIIFIILCILQSH